MLWLSVINVKWKNLSRKLSGGADVNAVLATPLGSPSRHTVHNTERATFLLVGQGLETSSGSWAMSRDDLYYFWVTFLNYLHSGLLSCHSIPEHVSDDVDSGWGSPFQPSWLSGHRGLLPRRAAWACCRLRLSRKYTVLCVKALRFWCYYSINLAYPDRQGLIFLQMKCVFTVPVLGASRSLEIHFGQQSEKNCRLRESESLVLRPT